MEINSGSMKLEYATTYPREKIRIYQKLTAYAYWFRIFTYRNFSLARFEMGI